MEAICAIVAASLLGAAAAAQEYPNAWIERAQILSGGGAGIGGSVCLTFQGDPQGYGAPIQILCLTTLGISLISTAFYAYFSSRAIARGRRSSYLLICPTSSGIRHDRTVGF